MLLIDAIKPNVEKFYATVKGRWVGSVQKKLRLVLAATNIIQEKRENLYKCLYYEYIDWYDNKWDRDIESINNTKRILCLEV